MNGHYKAILGIVSITTLLVNLLLFGLRVYGATTFWIIIIIIAIISFWLNKSKKK